MFLSVLFPDTEDSIPFASLEELQEKLDNFLENLESIYKNSFQQFYFSNMKTPVLFHINWLNGTITELSTIDLKIDLFRHISSFEATTHFMLMVEDGTITGCTEWELVFKVKVALGSYLFYLEPFLDRNSCPTTVVGNSDVSRMFGYDSNTKETPKSYGNNLKITKKSKTIYSSGLKITNFNHNMNSHDHNTNLLDTIDCNLNNDKSAIPQENSLNYFDQPSVRPYFNRQKLSFYNSMLKFGVFLLIVSFIDIIIIGNQLINAFMKHKYLLKTSPQYDDLDTYEQFHSTIGFWPPIFLITEICVLATGCFFVYDSQTFTQYPSVRTVMTYGFSAFLIITVIIRWLHSIPPCYSLVFIIRQAFGKLMIIIIGIAPIVMALALIAIFLFGFAGKITESMIILLESILSVTFGDMISDFYLSFTDGSMIYDILSFIYVTIAVAIAMWLFFTSFTAQMTSIYSSQVCSLIVGDDVDSD